MINLIDKVAFYVPDHGINGKDISDVILVNVEHHPDKMKNKCVSLDRT